MPERWSVSVFLSSPFPGAGTESVRSLRRGLRVPVLARVPMPERPDPQWLTACRSLMKACDSLSVSSSPPSGRSSWMVHEPGLDGGPGSRLWDMAGGRIDGFGGDVWPMLDSRRGRSSVGRASSPMVAVLWSPWSERPIPLDGCSSPDGLSVVATDEGAAPRRDFVRDPAAVCLSAVGRAGSAFPFALATCMAMGRPCVALMEDSDPPCRASEALVSAMGGRGCYVERTPQEAVSRACWLAAGGPEARRSALAGMQAACVFDISRNLAAFRDAMSSTGGMP